MAEFLLELLSEEIPARMQARAARRSEPSRHRQADGGGLELRQGRGLCDAAPPGACISRDCRRSSPIARSRSKGPARRRAGERAPVLPEGARPLEPRCLRAARQRARASSGSMSSAVAGRPTAEVLAAILPAAIAGIPWPKSMRWAYDRQSWVRPLRNIAAVLDGALVPFEVELGSPAHPHRIASRNETFGHRFLGPQSFVVADFKSYKARLLARQVMLDPAERRHTIRKQAESLSRGAHPQPPPRRGAARRSGRAGGMAGGPDGTHRRSLSWTCRRRC